MPVELSGTARYFLAELVRWRRDGTVGEGEFAPFDRGSLPAHRELEAAGLVELDHTDPNLVLAHLTARGWEAQPSAAPGPGAGPG